MFTSERTMTAKMAVTNEYQGNFVLEHKLQRRKDAWSNAQKSLLIDSYIRGYIVPPIYTIREKEADYVIDGIQRFSTLISYFNDKFSLSRNLQPIIIDDVEYKIAGKKYSALDEEVRDILDSAQVCFSAISDFNDFEIREIFKRLNAGKQLNITQKLTPLYSDKMIDIIFELMNDHFWNKILSPALFANSADQNVIIQTLMYIEFGDDFGFKKREKEQFVKYYNELLENEETLLQAMKNIALLKKSIKTLDNELTEEDKIELGSLSVVIYGMYYVYKNHKSTTKYITWLKDFIHNHDSHPNYREYVKSGTNSKDNVQGRVSYIKKAIDLL